MLSSSRSSPPRPSRRRWSGSGPRSGSACSARHPPAVRARAGRRAGISRSTLRQALTTLVQSGHLVSRARALGRHLRGRRAAARPGERSEPLAWGARARCSTTGWPSRPAPRCSRPSARRTRTSNALDALTEHMGATEGARFEVYRRADVRFHIGLAEASPLARLVAAMTEVQGQMSDLIQRIAHPDEVLTRSNAQHKRLVTLLRRQDWGRGRAPDARALRGDRAHPRRPDARRRRPVGAPAPRCPSRRRPGRCSRPSSPARAPRGWRRRSTRTPSSDSSA